MSKNLIFLFIIAALLSSCYKTFSERAGKAPEGIIPRDTFVLILADMEIAESAMREMQNIGKEIGELNEAYYHNIFSRYGIDRARFDSSMVYYRKDPKVIDKIYEDVITRLSMIESEVKVEDKVEEKVE